MDPIQLLQRQNLQLFRRVKAFVEREKPVVKLATVDKQLDDLTGVIDRLGVHAATQDSGLRLGKVATDQKKISVRELWEAYMRPVARAARTLFPDDPTLLRGLAMPRKRNDAQAIVAKATAMADTAEPYAAKFVAVGFAADFTTQLREAAQVVEATIDARRAQLARRANATRSAGEEVARGRAIVQLLDVAITPALRGTAGLLAEWQSITVMPRAGTPVSPAPVSPPVSAPVSTPVSALASTPVSTPVSTPTAGTTSTKTINPAEPAGGEATRAA